LEVRDYANDLLLLMLLVTPMAEAATVGFDAGGFTQQVEASSAQKLDLDWPAIQRLYESRAGRPIWHSDKLLNERGRKLLAWLVASETEGLNPADYHVNHLQLLLDPPLSDEDHTLRELLLSDGYLRLAVDLRQGNRAARALDPFGQVDAESFDPVATLTEALVHGNLHEVLKGLSPVRAEYDRLRRALAHYLSIEQSGGWPTLESDDSLRPGQSSPLITRLRTRLALESGRPVVWGEDPQLFDADLQSELRRYQVRNGLEADAVVGPATLQALNVPVSKRVAQLRANLERWRWLPHEMEEEHLLVNTAGFELALHSRAQVIFSGRTVNGTRKRPTPSLISAITHLVANPQWTVPRRIAIEDLLPQQQADPTYLMSKKIRVYQQVNAQWQEFDPATIDWSPYDWNYFPFVFKQDAGAGNSLGRVKFHMPNSSAIYLHDTPAVRLFGRSNRAFSSGCVRVEDADQLARLLITRADPWAALRFNRAMRSGETLITPLSDPLPVYLTYFTSWVDAAGEVHFRPDIYRRDTRLILALAREDPHVTARLEDGSLPASL
jgi:murein L,D-transpeptidase YcbB/YkuD